MQLSDFHFDLPKELIARYPLPTRSGSRLLTVNGKTGDLAHQQFSQIIDHLHPGDLLVFNDTKVIPARLFGKRSTGGKVEILIERLLDHENMTAQIRASKSLHIGERIYFTEDFYLEITDRKDAFFTLHYPNKKISILQFIEKIGNVPLPPYMQRQAEAMDKERYQTIYAKYAGSVAAPTAGFHFDEALMQQLKNKKINFGFLTLHIGAGTFMPIRVNDINQHQMHFEFLTITEKLCQLIQETKTNKNRIIAVGTTSMRALETAAQSGEVKPYHGETNIFIYPGYQFHCADALITNLHLPSSTLLMLVCAFGGYENMMRAYHEAVTSAYRFYSYGDAMFITKNSK